MYAKPALVRPRFASDFDPLVALWIARLSAGFSAAVSIFNDGLDSEALRQIFGFSPLDGTFSRSALKPLLKLRVEQLEQQRPRRKTILARNIDMLGALLGLDELHAAILTFAALSRQHSSLCELVDSIRPSSIDAVAKMLSIALKIRDVDIGTMLRPNGLLRASRIVSIEQSDIGRGIRLVIPSELCAALFSPADNIQMLMSAFLENAPPPQLKADAFSHLAQETALLTAYLSNACASGAPGVNILIYGSPGTGKTEYVRWLASHQGKPLYQVKAVDDQGDAISGLNRLAFFQLSQRYLQKSDALMLFDEIEDVFPSSDNPFLSRNPAAGKMFINGLLESNPIPSIWISNEVSHIDKAYLRRFDFSFEMGIPPIAIRRGILHNYLRGQPISDEVINALAQQEQLSPAQIEKAAKILRLSRTKAEHREATLLLVIENSRALLGQEKTDALPSLAECGYQLDYLNSDCDLTQLLAQLKRTPAAVGALCFYGAPGTGKTALAHHIASEIGVPLLAKRASDILSPYVGETEQKIALMFKQAKQDGALLLLDEADSFLTERQSAKNAWEVTAVNEMLTQMERFEGLFICSTNLMQRLDAASLRRFALKIKFDYLKPEQRWRLFLAHTKKFRRAHENEYRTTLNQLNNLTPGDFFTVRRQAALLSVTLTADELLKRLAQECRSKVGNENRQIGFIHSR